MKTRTRFAWLPAQTTQMQGGWLQYTGRWRCLRAVKENCTVWSGWAAFDSDNCKSEK